VATGFLARLIARAPSRETILWTVQRADIHPPGLAAFGLDPGRILFVATRTDAETLAVMEDALRTKGLAAVVGEASAVDLVAGKRLQLACEHLGTPAFLLRRQRRVAPRTKDMECSPAATRWRVAAEASGRDPALARAPGAPRWRVALEKCRGGRPGAWIMEVAYGASDVRVVARLGDHAPETGVADAASGLCGDDACGRRAAAHGG
jgi:protein ImuA